MIRYLTRSAAVVAATAATLLIAGCVNLPTSGQARHAESPLSTGGLSRQIGVELDPIPPGPSFMPRQIVRGFLAASGADLQVAKQYLTPGFAHAWQPSSLARVIDSAPTVTAFQGTSHETGNQPSDQVALQTQHLATLVSAGDDEPARLTVAPGGPFTFTFELTQSSNGLWRIDGIEDQFGKATTTLLLLTEDDFQRDYLPRDLYYPANSLATTLVPSPVYISATAGELGVQQLINGLASAQPGRLNWLWRAVTTAFPPGVRLRAQVRGSLAVVELQGVRGSLSETTLRQMEAQLVWTLTQSPYSSGTGVVSVELQYGHQSTNPLVLRGFRHWGPPSVLGPLYYQTLDEFGNPGLGEVSDVGASRDSKNSSHTTQQLPASLGHGPFTTFAVSPSQPGSTFTTSFAGCRGRQLWVAPLAPFLIGSDLLKTTLPSACTSLSWDDKGQLWVTTGNDIFVVVETPAGLDVNLVTIPWTHLPVTFSSLKVAPDGLRAAMIVKIGRRSSVYVAVISKKGSLTYLGQGSQTLAVGPDLVKPTALTWWDGDHLLVIDGGGKQTHLYNVPLDGGISAAVPTPPGTISIAANGAIAVVGTRGPKNDDQVHVMYSRDLDGIWNQFGNGTSVTYPG